MSSKNTAAEKTLSQDSSMPVNADTLLGLLENMGIDYELFEHRPVFTVEESETLPMELPGLATRNLFLKDKKGAMFLLTVGNDTALDLKKLPALLESKRLSFGSEARLWENLGVKPGSVCPFSVINDKEGAVCLVLDKAMMAADIVNYHPMENHLTIAIKPADLIRYAKKVDHDPWILDLTPAAPQE